LTDEKVRQTSSELSISFDELIKEPKEGTTNNSSSIIMKLALKTLYKYGILLVTDTPIDDNGAGIAALGASFGGGSIKTNPKTSVLKNYLDGGNDHVLPDGTDGPLRTLYGSVWATSSASQPDGTSVADSAYGSDGLPLHTDFTYVNDPPGLQIFTMVQPAPVGGESVFGDGFAVAEELRRVDPDSFDVLSTTIRTYHSIDHETGWYLKGSGPIIQLRNDDRSTIQSIRHNDLDRLPDLPPPSAPLTNGKQPNHQDYYNDDEESKSRRIDHDEFYDALDTAHKAWDGLLRQDKFRLVMRLNPGDTMVVANQRCFHGRYSFRSTTKSPRSVMGCYVSQDELSSRFRIEGYDC